MNPYESGRFAETSALDPVASPADVARIVEEMLADLEAHPGEWENTSLETFLDALSRSLRGLPQLYRNLGEDFPDPPTWKQLAEALVMATGYE
ncbi:hypothetical protein ONA91_26750 [Micromonospora sp. DR5-3]|uniref:DUF7660 family protein n=1 Tax=unclassified Micromonospora TaxID=2617518 RepID=UPI0011D5BAC2|nr:MULTISPECIES: hypothetical protein [unclassified Micromonospora]MCW3818053.1 hypothetical protein [Micromonospora sp. DR5-3]TYC26351.1 hypothetical protein FXF52_03105 [Micromonospora sp. MP36]